MSLTENCAIMRQVQAEARRRYEARIDRELKRGPWADLFNRAQLAQVALKAERRQHRLTVERGSGPNGYQRWGRVGGYHVACSCGWHGKPTYTRRLAEQDLKAEREYMFRPLVNDRPAEHSEST